jgi:hypothetical protein
VRENKAAELIFQNISGSKTFRLTRKLLLAYLYFSCLILPDAWLIQAARDNGVTAGKPEEFTNGSFT